MKTVEFLLEETEIDLEVLAQGTCQPPHAAAVVKHAIPVQGSEVALEALENLDDGLPSG